MVFSESISSDGYTGESAKYLKEIDTSQILPKYRGGKNAFPTHPIRSVLPRYQNQTNITRKVNYRPISLLNTENKAN